jgi:hypothetical protein
MQNGKPEDALNEESETEKPLQETMNYKAQNPNILP